MLFKLTNISVILLITTLINFFTALIGWRRRNARSGMYFALGLFALAFWTLASGFDYAAVPIPLKVFFSKLEYIGYNCALAFIVLFAIYYGGHDHWLNSNWVKALLWIIPASNIMLALTNSLHGWLWTGFTRSEFGDNIVIFHHGPAFIWTTTTGYLAIAIMLAILWSASRRGEILARRQSRLLFYALLIPIFGNLLYLLDIKGIQGIDWTSILFSISGVILLVALYGTRFLDIVPIARRQVFEQMNDGVLVLDTNNNLVDFNLAAGKLFQLHPNVLGNSISGMKPIWPEVVELVSSLTTGTSQIIISNTDHSDVFDMHLTLLENDIGQAYGKLLVFRNITEKHWGEKALQENENLMRTVAENYPNSFLLIIEKDFTIGFTSGNEYKKQNLEPGQFIGMPLEEFFEDQGIMIQQYFEKTFSGEEQAFELYINEQHQLFRTVPLSNEDGSIPRILAVVENVNSRRQTERLNRFRLELWEYAASHPLGELMQKALDEICTLIRSPIGFYHFVEDDQKTLTLQAWSTRTLEEFCQAEGQGLHYNIDEAGVWVDAFHQKKPVIHNDYAALPHRKGLPEGHAEVIRQLVVPVLRENKVVSILGIGNKPSDYNENDVELVSTIADLVWTIISHKQAEEKIRQAQVQLGEQQRELAVIEERQRMARDLHDSVNQSIHSMVLFSDTLAVTLEKKNLERARQIIDRLQESARQSLKETRLLLYEMHTEGAERSVDLIQDLETRLATVEQRAGIRSQVILEGSLDNCPEKWRENLFWITIEALNNSLKHAQARNVNIVIRCLPDRIELEVKDNGKGFESGKTRLGGMGLSNMRSRAEELGGTLAIESEPEKGTTVRFTADPKGFKAL